MRYPALIVAIGAGDGRRMAGEMAGMVVEPKLDRAFRQG